MGINTPSLLFIVADDISVLKTNDSGGVSGRFGTGPTSTLLASGKNTRLCSLASTARARAASKTLQVEVPKAHTHHRVEGAGGLDGGRGTLFTALLPITSIRTAAEE